MKQQEAVFVHGLSKTYRSFRSRPVRALDNLTLRIAKGTAFGLVGPNGAGKTTLLKALIGAVRATAGVATVFGEPAGSRAARRVLGYVAECASAPEHLTARQLLEYHAALYAVSAADLGQRVDELLDEVGLGSRSVDRLEYLSKGMRQRAAIAAALVHRPRMLLLDEPTDGLDPEGRCHVLDLLRHLHRDLGVTLLVSSHLLNDLEGLCDGVAMLNRGQLVRHGELRTLTAGQGYSLILDGVPMELAGILQSRFAFEPAEAGALRLNVPSREELDWTMEQVRMSGARIERLAPRTATLEEVYLAATREEMTWR